MFSIPYVVCGAYIDFLNVPTTSITATFILIGTEERSEFCSHCNAGLVRLITVPSPAVWYKGVSIADLMGSRHHGEPPYQIWSVKWYPSQKSVSPQPTQVNGMFLSLWPLPISKKYFNWRKYFCENVWVRWMGPKVFPHVEILPELNKIKKL